MMTSYNFSLLVCPQGMAMGAQATVVDTLHIFIAIVAHKGLAAYALGSSVVDSGASKMRFWSVIAVFALATPLGIGLGSVVARFSNSGPAAALSALASGKNYEHCSAAEFFVQPRSTMTIIILYCLGNMLNTYDLREHMRK